MNRIGNYKSMRKIILEQLESDTDGKSLKEVIAIGLINKAADGDVKAFETITKFIGEYPTEYKANHTDEEIEKDNLFLGV